MKWLKKLSQVLLALVVATPLTGCSKTVQWEEEVPLNTGQVIWVKRTVVYSSQGGAGNPLDVMYRPEKDQAIDFTWSGKRYHYKGEARIMLLAISPQGQPVFVAPAPGNAWYARYKYPCTIPYYVQLVPTTAGTSWVWPPSIEPWLYNLPANLLQAIGDPNTMQARYTHVEKKSQQFLADSRLRYRHKVEPGYTGDMCKKEER